MNLIELIMQKKIGEATAMCIAHDLRCSGELAKADRIEQETEAVYGDREDEQYLYQIPEEVFFRQEV